MARSRSKLLRVAIVGASTLKGREVKSVLSERHFPVDKLVLMDSAEDLGRLTEHGGEPVVSLAIEAESFEFLDLVFFAGEPAITRSFAPFAQEKQFLGVDLTNAYYQDELIPLFLRGDAREIFAVEPFQGIVASPHPAALSIATILMRLNARHPIGQCVVNIFEPASERGSAGVEELEKQTLNLFSFQPSPSAVFDRQLAFNLLSRLGEESKGLLLDVEAIIRRHLKVLLGETCPLPALTLIQAPVFHAHCFSVFLKLNAPVQISELESSLKSEYVDVIPTGDEPPSPVQVAGTDAIQLGGLKRDLETPNGFWFWAASDNLRLSAINAVAAAEHFLLKTVH